MNLTTKPVKQNLIDILRARFGFDYWCLPKKWKERHYQDVATELLLYLELSQWISTSAKLPKEHTCILAVRENCTGQPYYASYDGEKWIDLVSNTELSTPVLYWMEIPKSPLKKENENASKA